MVPNSVGGYLGLPIVVYIITNENTETTVMSSDTVCVDCNKKEGDLSKLITCFYCFKNAHFKCKGIAGNALRRMKENPYFCSPNCANIYRKIVEMQNDKSTAIQAMTSELKASVFSAVSAEMQAVRGEEIDHYGN